MVKTLPAMQVTQVLSLGRKDPLEKDMATHSNILAWKISWTEEQSCSLKELDMTEQLSLSLDHRKAKRIPDKHLLLLH